MGCRISHTHVFHPRSVIVSSSVPLAMATVPSGTVTRNVNVALSVGWSLEGNHEFEAAGSATTNVPRGVVSHPNPKATWLSNTGSGVPEYSTATTNVSPPAMGDEGATTRSRSVLEKEAATPSTATESTSSSEKSRLNVASPSVAVAVMVARPVSSS